MPRKSRKSLGTPFLHVMVQGVNKEYIFYKEYYIKEYLKTINEKRKDYNFEIIAYCIMNNHAHFLVYVEDIDEFGQFMQNVNLIYAKMYNKIEKRCGVLFRNRYQAEPIYNSQYLINCIKYIHNNPVKAKIVKKCEEYKYSSYNDYLRNIGFSQSKIMKQIFGEKCNYLELFNEVYERKYMDIYDNNELEYIQIGINEFKDKENVDIGTILSDRNCLKKLIKFLKEKCNLKYVEIQKFLNIPRGTMDCLKIN